MIRTRIFRAMLLRRREPDADAPLRPVTTITLVSLVAAMHVAGAVLAFAGVSPGSLFALSIEGAANLELWRVLSFCLSCFSPVAVDSGSFLPSVMAASLHFALVIAVLALAGRRAEARMGSMPLMLAVVGATVAHALLALLVFRHGSVFSPVAAAVTVLTISQLSRFERRDEQHDPTEGMSLMVGGFLLLMVVVSAAFEAEFVQAAVGLLVGPLVGMGAFAWVRTAEVWRLETEGTGTVAGVLFADDTELLTMEELRETTDKLLAQISSEGIASLDKQQRQFLARASVRLKSMQAVDDAANDDDDKDLKSGGGAGRSGRR